MEIRPPVRSVPPNSFILLHREIWYDNLFFFFFVTANRSVCPPVSTFTTSSRTLVRKTLLDSSPLETQLDIGVIMLYFLILKHHRIKFHLLPYLCGLPIYWAHWKEKPLSDRPSLPPSLCFVKPSTCSVGSARKAAARGIPAALPFARLQQFVYRFCQFCIRNLIDLQNNF